MNQVALTSLGRMFHTARRDRRITLYQVAQMFDVPSSVISSVENGEIAPDDPILEKMAEQFGIPLKMVDACRRPPRREATRSEIPTSEPPMTNVISIESYREKKWRQMSLFERD